VPAAAAGPALAGGAGRRREGQLHERELDVRGAALGGAPLDRAEVGVEAMQQLDDLAAAALVEAHAEPRHARVADVEAAGVVRLVRQRGERLEQRGGVRPRTMTGAASDNASVTSGTRGARYQRSSTPRTDSVRDRATSPSPSSVRRWSAATAAVTPIARASPSGRLALRRPAEHREAHRVRQRADDVRSTSSNDDVRPVVPGQRRARAQAPARQRRSRVRPSPPAPGARRRRGGRTGDAARAPHAFVPGAAVGVLGGLIGLGGADFRRPLLIGLFGFVAL